MVKMKFHSEGTQIISQTMLNGLKQYSIESYLNYCDKVDKISLSVSSRKVFDGLNPKTRKRLADVDNFYLDGIEEFTVSLFFEF